MKISEPEISEVKKFLEKWKDNLIQILTERSNTFRHEDISAMYDRGMLEMCDRTLCVIRNLTDENQ